MEYQIPPSAMGGDDLPDNLTAAVEEDQYLVPPHPTKLHPDGDTDDGPRLRGSPGEEEEARKRAGSDLENKSKAHLQKIRTEIIAKKENKRAGVIGVDARKASLTSAGGSEEPKHYRGKMAQAASVREIIERLNKKSNSDSDISIKSDISAKSESSVKSTDSFRSTASQDSGDARISAGITTNISDTKITSLDATKDKAIYQTCVVKEKRVRNSDDTEARKSIASQEDEHAQSKLIESSKSKRFDYSRLICHFFICHNFI